MRLFNKLRAQNTAAFKTTNELLFEDVLSVKLSADDIFHAWTVCLKVQPALRTTTWPHVVGLVLDAHVVKIPYPELTFAALYRKKLAATQQYKTLTLAVSRDIHAVVSALWLNAQPTKKPKSFPFAKLIDKGMINPKSVRYICPQIMRCGSCPRSQRCVTEMLRRWLLGSYPHRHEVVSPALRAKVMQLSFADLLALIRQQPSKHLYCVVAECIAAVSVSDPTIHIVAASSNPNFAAYVDAVCTNAATVAKLVLGQLAGNKGRRRRPQLAHVLFNVKHKTLVQTSYWPKKVTIIPTTAKVAEKQKKLAQSIYGMPDVKAFVCDTCCIVHGAQRAKTRGNRIKAGVSVNLSNVDDIVCNSCNSAVYSQSFVGIMAITNKCGSVTVCCKCANVSGNVTTINDGIYCKQCAPSVVAEQILPECVCGEPAAYNATRKHAFVASNETASSFKVYTPCQEHLPLISTLLSAKTKKLPLSKNV